MTQEKSKIDNLALLLSILVSSICILATIFSTFLWMNGKFNEIDHDLCMIKTVLLTKGIMPECFANDSLHSDNKSID